MQTDRGTFTSKPGVIWLALGVGFGIGALALMWAVHVWTGTLTFWPAALAIVVAQYVCGFRSAALAATIAVTGGLIAQFTLQTATTGIVVRSVALATVFAAALLLFRRAELAEVRSRESRREMRRERDLLEGILATSAAGIVVVSRSGEIIFANQRAETILGLAKNEIETRRYDSPEWGVTGIDGSPWPDAKQPVARVFAEGEPVYDVRHAIVWPDGRRRLLSVNAAPMRDAQGNFTAAVAAVNDITDALEAEQALADIRDREQRVLETSPGALYEYELRRDGAQGFTFIAPRAKSLLGLDPDAIMHDAQVIWDRLPREQVDELREALLLSARRLTPWNVTFRYRDDEGRERWMHKEAITTRLPDGTVRWSGIMSDVTVQKEMEASLARAQRLEGLGRLAGGLAHDFNNILTVITASAESARDVLPPGHEAREDVDEVLHASTRAAALTRQLLTLSRRQVLTPRPLDLRALVREIGSMSTRVLGGTIQLRIEAAGGPVAVLADHAQIEQVMLNLIVNARDAMPNGGTLALTVRDDVPEGPPGMAGRRWCVVEVRDSGVGIDEETQRRIFDPFYTTKQDGTGLGLATSYASVQQAGGTITVESAPGKGTTFRVWLPRVDDVTPEHAFPLTPKSVAMLGDGRQLLVVDDDDAVREVMRRELATEHEVKTARSGDEALAIAAELGPRLDAVVTDVMMPGMRGTDLAARLRERYPALRILFVTGYAGDRVVPDTTEAPGTAFLAKPFTGSQLRQAVQELLRLETPTAS